LDVRYLLASYFLHKPSPSPGKYKKRGRLKTDTVTNDSLGASLIEGLAHENTLDSASISMKAWISDGRVIFVSWQESQQVDFCRTARVADSNMNQIFLAIAAISQVQREPSRRAESELQEGLQIF
jgi:hypothetical protein